MDWECPCCQSPDKLRYLTKTELVNVYGIPEVNIGIVEEQARKQIREQETRKQAKQLMNYLKFTDIEDFEDEAKTQYFEEIDFFSDDTDSELKESEDYDDDYDYDSQGLMKSRGSSCQMELATVALSDKRDEENPEAEYLQTESLVENLEEHQGDT